jgi:hypothetical protein
MCAMTRPRDSAPAAIAPASVIPQPLHAPLLWGGALLCAIGMATTGLWQDWHGGRFVELLVLAAFSAALAWPLRRFARMHLATALACVWLAALVVFADPLPVLAVLVVAAAATVAGGWVAGAAAPMALACACGLALLAGVLGWLLPLPLHHRWSYLVLCAVLVGVGHCGLRAQLHALHTEWSAAVDPHPRAAALGVLALGLASTGCWLPTMQFDDLAYHLGLPWQLQTTGRYVLDPTHQVWALAPWAADVQHALPQVIAGAEARGPLNALWIAMTAAGLWRLAAALGLDMPARWGVIALYAGIPLTAGLAAGMQTETMATGLLVWLAWLVARDRREATLHAPLAGATLAGGLIGLKLIGIGYVFPLLAWAALSRPPWPRGTILLAAGALMMAIAGSSYVHAAWVAGNPVLPLFNATFQSPYFAPSDFEDARWHAGVSVLSAWQVTFHTADYGEFHRGAAGFTLVALSGAWLLAIAGRRWRALAVVASALLVAVFLPLQYVRYAFPAMVLLLPALAGAASAADPRRWTWLIAGIALSGLAFQPNANWMQRTGALKRAVRTLGADAPLLERYAPERLFATALREGNAGSVLFLDPNKPSYAELGTRGRTTAWYAPDWAQTATLADGDASGATWVRVWKDAGVSDIVLRPGTLQPAQAAALRRAGAVRHASAGHAKWIGEAQWWRLPAEQAP